MVLEDIYNMDETSSFYCAQPNKTLAQRKLLWAQNLEGSSHSCSCYKHDKHCQVETYDYLQIFAPKMLWKVVANKIRVMVCKPNGMDDIRGFESWMMSLNVHF